MNALAVGALRVLLVIVFILTLAGQVFVIPLAASGTAQDVPEFAYLAVPYALQAITLVACVQVALIALWMLLSKVRTGKIFDPSAFVWVNGIIAAASLATVLVFALQVQTLSTGPGGLVLMLGAVALAGAAFVLVMIVMRGLLHQAMRLQSELAEVV